MEVENPCHHYMKCANCNNVFENCDPFILPCLHSICPICFKRIKTSESSVCPTCFEKFDWRETNTNLLPTDHHRRDVLEYFKIIQDKRESLVCKKCGDEVACAKCSECIEVLCQVCLRSHKNFLKNHSVISFAEIRQTTFQETITLLICPEHKFPIQRYCLNDRQPICRYCEVSFHQSNENHLVEDIVGVYSSKRQELEVAASECKRTFGTVIDHKASIENEILKLDDIKQKHMEAIDGSINNFIAVLEKRREELKCDLNFAVKRNGDDWNKKLELLKELESKFREALHFASLYTEYLGQADFCQVESLITDRFHNIAEKDVLSRSEEGNGKITFVHGDITLLSEIIFSNNWLSLVDYKIFVYDKITHTMQDEKEVNIGYMIISLSKRNDVTSTRCPLQAVVRGNDGKELHCNISFNEINKKYEITATLITGGVYSLAITLNKVCIEERQFMYAHLSGDERQFKEKIKLYGTKERLDDLETSTFLEEEMQCPKCNKFFNTSYEDSCPRVLPCLHAVDSECLRKEIKDDKIKCPVCEFEHPVKDADITGFTKDETRKNVSLYWKIRSEITFIPCSEHNGDRAEFWCQKCDAFICQRCMSNHYCHQHQPLISLPDLETLKSLPIRKLHTNHTCEEHGHECRLLELFCLTCDKIICHECFFNSHKCPEHVIEKISRIYEKRFAEITTLLEQVAAFQEKTNSEVLEAKEALQMLRQTENREIKEIRKAFNNCKTIIARRKNTLETELKTFVSNEREKLQCHLNELQEKQKFTAMSFDRALDLIGFSSEVSFLKLYPTIKKRLESLSTIDSSKQTHACGKVLLKFVEDNLLKNVINMTVKSGQIFSPNICPRNTKHWTNPLRVQENDVCLRLQCFDTRGNILSHRDLKYFMRLEVVDSKGQNIAPNITITFGDIDISVRAKFDEPGEYYLKVYICHTSLATKGFKINVRGEMILQPDEHVKEIDVLETKEIPSEISSVSQKYIKSKVMASSSPNEEEGYIPVDTDCDTNTVSVTQKKETYTKATESAYISQSNNTIEQTELELSKGGFESNVVTESALDAVSGSKADQSLFENEKRNLTTSSPKKEEGYIPVDTDCEKSTVSVTQKKETYTEATESAYISQSNNTAEQIQHKLVKDDFKSYVDTESAADTVSGSKAYQPPPSDESTICSSRKEKDVPENENAARNTIYENKPFYSREGQVVITNESTAHNTINESTLLDRREEQVALGNDSKAQNTLNESILTEGIAEQSIVEGENKAHCELMGSARSDLKAEKPVHEKGNLEGKDLCENSRESIDKQQSESNEACSMGCVFDKVNNTETGSKSRQGSEKSFQDICHFDNSQASDRLRYCDKSEYILDNNSSSFTVSDNAEKTPDICKPKVPLGNPVVSSFSTGHQRGSVLPSVGRRLEGEEKKLSDLFQECGAERSPHVPGRAKRIENHSSIVSEYDASQSCIVQKSKASEKYNGLDQNKDDHEKNIKEPNDKNNDIQFRGIDQKWNTNDDDLYDEAREKYEYFWGAESPFSQWFYSVFFIDNTKFTCAEQYMMYKKAILFGDCENANKILKARDPRKLKMLGRQVCGFNAEKWNDNCLAVVKQANIAKFSQYKNIKNILFETHPKIFVEASPLDAIWGIGLAEDEADAWDKARWRGKNYLGYILTEVRDELMADEGKIDKAEKKVYIPDLKNQLRKEKESVNIPEEFEMGTAV